MAEKKIEIIYPMEIDPKCITVASTINMPELDHNAPLISNGLVVSPKIDIPNNTYFYIKLKKKYIMLGFKDNEGYYANRGIIKLKSYNINEPKLEIAPGTIRVFKDKETGKVVILISTAIDEYTPPAFINLPTIPHLAFSSRSVRVDNPKYETRIYTVKVINKGNYTVNDNTEYGLILEPLFTDSWFALKLANGCLVGISYKKGKSKFIGIFEPPTISSSEALNLIPTDTEGVTFFKPITSIDKDEFRVAITYNKENIRNGSYTGECLFGGIDISELLNSDMKYDLLKDKEKK